jgi:hypothetical protein
MIQANGNCGGKHLTQTAPAVGFRYVHELEVQREIGYLLSRIFLKTDIHGGESRERSLPRFLNGPNEIAFFRGFQRSLSRPMHFFSFAFTAAAGVPA